MNNLTLVGEGRRGALVKIMKLFSHSDFHFNSFVEVVLESWLYLCWRILEITTLKDSREVKDLSTLRVTKIVKRPRFGQEQSVFSQVPT